MLFLLYTFPQINDPIELFSHLDKDLLRYNRYDIDSTIGTFMSSSPVEAFTKIINKFKWALSSLDYMPTSYQLENLSLLVLEGMSGSSRLYHSHDHVIELAEDLDPIGAIAALFHDIVYYQVDGGMAQIIYAKIYRYFNEVNGILFTSQNVDDDFVYECTLRIFGFNKGEQLLGKHQNEFLSALFALKVMSDVLSKQELLMVCVCIEATIPFRAHTDALDTLEKRLRDANTHFHLGILEEDIKKGIHRAVVIANRDVESFANDHVGNFLEETWKLLPESNDRLIKTSMFSIREYRTALGKMEGFLSFLNPACIYYCYENTPNPEDMQKKVQCAKNNLDIASKYLRIKIYSTAILEALSDITGGDIPLNFFMGDIKPRNLSTVSRMEDYLIQNPIDMEESQDRGEEVEYLLTHGRASDSMYDAKASPYSAFIYKYLGESFILSQFECAKNMFIKKLTSDAFLKMQPAQMIERIAFACAQVSFTRKSRLLSIRKILK